MVTTVLTVIVATIAIQPAPVRESGCRVEYKQGREK